MKLFQYLATVRRDAALLWQIVAAVYWFKIGSLLQQNSYIIKILDLHSISSLDWIKFWNVRDSTKPHVLREFGVLKNVEER